VHVENSKTNIALSFSLW